MNHVDLRGERSFPLFFHIGNGIYRRGNKLNKLISSLVSPRRIFRGAVKIFSVSKYKNWFCKLLVSIIFWGIPHKHKQLWKKTKLKSFSCILRGFHHFFKFYNITVVPYQFLLKVFGQNGVHQVFIGRALTYVFKPEVTNANGRVKAGVGEFSGKSQIC